MLSMLLFADITKDMDYFHGAISVQTAKRILLTSSKGEKIGRYLLREVEDSHIISYVDAKEKVDHILLPKQSNSKLLQFNPHLVSAQDIVEFIAARFDGKLISAVSAESGGKLDKPKILRDDKTCNVCEERFKNAEILHATHMQKHRIKYCDECHIIVKSNMLVGHMHHRHMPKSIQCEQCDYKTSYKKNMKNHVERIHNSKEKSFICNLCNFRASTKEKLENHQNREHGFRFQCKNFKDLVDPNLDCERTFSDRQSLQKHLFKHGVGGHPCLSCNERFYDQKDLIRHKKIDCGSNDIIDR